MLFTACSEEPSVSTNENSSEFNLKSGHVDLSLLYKAMIESDEYVIMSNSLNIFADKLHFDNSVALEKEEDLFTWGRSNISKTDFSDFNELVANWSDIKEKQKIVLGNHKDFFSGVADNYPNVYFDIPRNPEVPQGNCPCQPQLSTCEYNADQTRKWAIYSSMIIDAVSGGGREAGISLALMNHSAAIDACNSAYNECIKDCTF